LSKRELLVAQGVQNFEAILARMSQRVHSFLSITEQQLAFGQINSDIFERNRQYVDSRLYVIAPGVLQQFQSAYRRVGENEPEARSHALTSCRRILKSLADHLYPSVDESVKCSDGIERKMGKEQYKNRLWWLVRENTQGHGSGEMVMGQIEDLCNRIDRVYELSCKGVHANPDRYEVDQCVIQTYLLVGDILRIVERRSPASST